MLGWIWRTIIGNFKTHQHSWETIKIGRWEDAGMKTAGDQYTLRCKTCGDVKAKSL